MQMKLCSMCSDVILKLGFSYHLVHQERNGLELDVCALVSQVGFRDYKAVLKTKVEERVNAIVNRLNGTKRDVPHPDLAGEREAYEKEVGGWLIRSDVYALAAQPCHSCCEADMQCRLKGALG